MPKEFLTKSPEETKTLAGELLPEIIDARIILLSGDLAAGKTTFVQGLGEKLGLPPLVSPTFGLIKEYPLNYQNLKYFYHLDLYRLQSINEARSFNFQELLDSTSNLIIVEWPDRLNFLPDHCLQIEFKRIDFNQRQIKIAKT